MTTAVNDTIYGGIGNDVIDGGGDRDLLYGEAGNDVIYGGAGNDEITGGEGNDIINGGEGNDKLHCPHHGRPGPHHQRLPLRLKGNTQTRRPYRGGGRSRFRSHVSFNLAKAPPKSWT